MKSQLAHTSPTTSKQLLILSLFQNTTYLCTLQPGWGNIGQALEWRMLHLYNFFYHRCFSMSLRVEIYVASEPGKLRNCIREVASQGAPNAR